MAWTKIDDGYRHHPKMLAAGLEALGLDVCAMTYASQHRTDGFIPDYAVAALYPTPKSTKLVATLVKVGRWHRDDTRGGYWIHDYLAYNPSAEEAEAEAEARREKATNAARARWDARNNGHGDAQSNATSMLQAMPEAMLKPCLASPEKNAPSRPVPSRPPRLTSGQDLESVEASQKSDLIPKNGTENPTAEHLAERLAELCTAKTPKKLDEARAVVGICLEHADWRVVDEAIGRCVNEKPALPRYLFKAFRDQARNYGITVPDLSLTATTAAAS